MATIEQLEAALRAADAAGNVDDAKRLAQAYVAARGSQQPAPQAAPAAPQGPPDSYSRQLGLGVRSALEGVASVPDFLGAPAYGAYRQSEGREPVTFGGLATAASDAMGLPKPATPTERVISDVSRAGTGTAVTLGAGSALPAASKLGQFLGSNPVQQGVASITGATAGGVTRENGGGEGAQMMATLAGGISPALLTTVPQMALRLIMRGGEAGRQAMQAVMADFKAAGASPSVGQATQRPVWRGVESFLSKIPGGSGVMTDAAQRQGADIGVNINNMAQTLSPRMDATRAGVSIDRGINGPDGFLQRTRATQSALYDKLDQHISPDTRVDVSNTRAVLPQLNPTIPGAPALSQMFQNARINGIHQGFEADVAGVPALMTRGGLPEWADSMRTSLQHQADAITKQNVLRTSLGQKPLPVPTAAQIEQEVQGRLAGQVDHRLPYQAVKKTRTLVGQEIADAGIGADVPRSKWNPLYGALSQDMGVAAHDAGPEAQQAWNRANNYTRALEGRKADIAPVVDKAGGGEAIFRAAISNTKEGATTLTKLMRSLPEGSRKDVAAAVLQRMGKATSGNQNAAGDVFSSGTFLTNWNNLSQQARSALFDRLGPEFRAQVDAITRVASNLRDGSKVFANPSGTAITGAHIGGYTALGSTGVGALLGHPVPFLATAGAMGGANLSARSMTSPAVVKYLANQTQTPTGVMSPLMRLLQQSGYQPNQQQ